MNIKFAKKLEFQYLVLKSDSLSIYHMALWVGMSKSGLCKSTYEENFKKVYNISEKKFLIFHFVFQK